MDRNKHPLFYKQGKGKADKSSKCGSKVLIRKGVTNGVMTSMAHHTMFPVLKEEAKEMFGPLYSYILVGGRATEVNDVHFSMADKMRKKIYNPMTSTYHPRDSELGYGHVYHGKCSQLLTAIQGLTYMILTQVPTMETNDSCYKNPILKGGVRPVVNFQSKATSDSSFVFLIPPPNNGWETKDMPRNIGRACYDDQIEISYTTPHFNKTTDVICSLPFLTYAMFEHHTKPSSTFTKSYKEAFQKIQAKRLENHVTSKDLSNLSFETESENDEEEEKEEQEPAEKKPRVKKTVQIKDITPLVVASAKTCDQFNKQFNVYKQLINRASKALANTGRESSKQIGYNLTNTFDKLQTEATAIDKTLVAVSNECFQTTHKLCSHMLAAHMLKLIKDSPTITSQAIYDYIRVLDSSPGYNTDDWKVVESRDINMERFCAAFCFKYNRALEKMSPVSSMSENIVAITFNQDNDALKRFLNSIRVDNPDDAASSSLYDKALIWERNGWTSNTENIRNKANENNSIYDLIWVNSDYHSKLQAAIDENERNRGASDAINEDDAESESESVSSKSDDDSSDSE